MTGALRNKNNVIESKKSSSVVHTIRPEEVMAKQAWITTDCDDGGLVGVLNDLDDKGYMPWELGYMDVQDSSKTSELKKDRPNHRSCEVAAEGVTRSRIAGRGTPAG